MTSLARRTSGSKNPAEYKDYVNFIETYRQSPAGSLSSRTSSSTSLNSDSSFNYSTNTKCESYSTFLENSKNKRFGSVRPPKKSDFMLNQLKKFEGEETRKTNNNNVVSKKKIFETVKSFDQVDKTRSKLIQHLGNSINNELIKNEEELPLPPAPVCDPYMDVSIPNDFPPPPPTFMDSKCLAPPPPPMPVSSSKVPKMPAHVTATINISPTEINKNGIRRSNGIEAKNTNGVDKNNPLVRKLVYGAMLDMYGAYHDKANNYVSTLPKNMVKKQNGIQDIINNIAAQGGLEKLSGRSNPKTENE